MGYKIILLKYSTLALYYSFLVFVHLGEKREGEGRRTRRIQRQSQSVCLHIRRESYRQKRESKAHIDTISNSKSSGCVGCYQRPTITTTVDEPSKGLTKQGKAVEKPSTSEDFWTTSTHDMDNSAVQSQGSISSTSITNQAVVPQGGSSNSGNPAEFVNHGLILWNQTRQRWVGNKKSENRTQQLREPKLSWNATYESLLGSNKPFRQPIPLAEMVDFLVDIWEQDGLYD